ncbi:hypothetical protein, partial [Saccharibacillus qingshengii]|uniref:hypothetical protein n=1 Tax=Saccharibacillus qingshengii TaxID=1763540 RepID=UPI0015552A20
MKKLILVTAAALVISASTGILVNNHNTNNQETPTNPAKVESKQVSKGGVSQSTSVANFYGSLEELTNSADLIAEVEITGLHKENPQAEFARYTANVIDVISGNPSQKEIVINALAPLKVEEGVSVETDDPPFTIGEKNVLFLKKGSDTSIESLYFVSGVYQGRFEIENETVIAVNPDYGKELASEENKGLLAQSTVDEDYIPGENIVDFKAKIQKIDSRACTQTYLSQIRIEIKAKKALNMLA